MQYFCVCGGGGYCGLHQFQVFITWQRFFCRTFLSTICRGNMNSYCSDCRRISQQINNFLQLDLKRAARAGGSPILNLPQDVMPPFEGADASPATDDCSPATSSDESFERLSASDLNECDSAASEARCPLSDTLSDKPIEATAGSGAITDNDKTSCSEDISCE